MTDKLPARANFRDPELPAASVLEALLANFDTGDFFANVWAQTHAHFADAPHSNEERFASLIAEREIDAFLTRELLPAHFIKVSAANRSYSRHEWTTLDVRRQFDGLQMVDHEKLFALFRDGASIIIGTAEKHFEGLRLCCDKLGELIGCNVQANLYITPPAAQAFAVHYDTHDVIVAQITGEKEWRIYNCPWPEPAKFQNCGPETLAMLGDETRSAVLKAGESLYIPRGWFHEVFSRHVPSIHITFGLHQNLLDEVIEERLKGMMQESRWRVRKPLPSAGDEEKAAFHKKLGSLIAAFSEAETARPQSGSARPRPSFSAVLEEGVIGADTLVIGVDRGAISREKRGNEIALSAGTSSLAFPAFLAETMEDILSEQPIRIADMRGLAVLSGKVELATQAIRTGFARVVTQTDGS